MTCAKKPAQGMMDCKNALSETDGDIEAAVEWGRKKGLAQAAKKTGRVAAEGLVGVAVEANVGVVVEVNPWKPTSSPATMTSRRWCAARSRSRSTMRPTSTRRRRSVRTTRAAAR